MGFQKDMRTWGPIRDSGEPPVDLGPLMGLRMGTRRRGPLGVLGVWMVLGWICNTGPYRTRSKWGVGVPGS